MLKVALAIGSAIFAMGVTICVMALLDGGRMWPLDVRLCATSIGGAFIAVAVLWFAVLWFGLDRIRRPTASEEVTEVEDIEEEIKEVEAPTAEIPVIKINSRQVRFDSSVFRWDKD